MTRDSEVTRIYKAGAANQLVTQILHVIKGVSLTPHPSTSNQEKRVRGHSLESSVCIPDI